MAKGQLGKIPILLTVWVGGWMDKSDGQVHKTHFAVKIKVIRHLGGTLPPGWSHHCFWTLPFPTPWLFCQYRVLLVDNCWPFFFFYPWSRNLVLLWTLFWTEKVQDGAFSVNDFPSSPFHRTIAIVIDCHNFKGTHWINLIQSDFGWHLMWR